MLLLLLMVAVVMLMLMLLLVLMMFVADDEHFAGSGVGGRGIPTIRILFCKPFSSIVLAAAGTVHRPHARQRTSRIISRLELPVTVLM
jgi:hypothetical protein